MLCAGANSGASNEGGGETSRPPALKPLSKAAAAARTAAGVDAPFRESHVVGPDNVGCLGRPVNHLVVEGVCPLAVAKLFHHLGRELGAQLEKLRRESLPGESPR